MDMWLHRTFLEQGGGGNAGESYGLAHYFAATHCVTDHWEKRGKKGLLVTIGDEPSLSVYPTRAMKEIMGGDQASSFNDKEMLKAAKEKWEVFHINPRPESTIGDWRDSDTYWKDLLGQNYIKVKRDYAEVPRIMEELIIKVGKSINTPNQEIKSDSTESEDIY